MKHRGLFLLQLGFTLLVCAFLIVPVILSIMAGLTVNYFIGIESGLTLRWVFEEGAVRRMRPYAISLGGATAVGYALFASNANRLPVCDALSPVWTSILILASGVLLLLSLLVATLSLGTGRTTVLQGTVHLVLFAVYLFTTVVP